MKKFVLALSALAAAALTCVCTLSENVGLKASAAEYFYDYSRSYDVDCDGDGYAETTLYFEADIPSKTATITEIYSDADDIVIPAVLEDVYVWTEEYFEDGWYTYVDSNEYDLTVTSIEIEPTWSYSGYEYNSVEIPETVQYIAPQSIGYYYEDRYDEETYESYEVIVKDENLTIICTKGTAAETYAIENGFNYIAYGNLSQAAITLTQKSYTYTGKAIKPSATVTLDGKTLVQDVDYTLEYKSNTNAGTATVTAKGKGDYRGSISATFTITKKSASGAKVSAVAQQSYTGKAVKPSLTVTLGGVKLISGKDYTVSYSSNINPGTAKAKLTFKGNYSGSKTVSFKIALAKMKSVKVAATSNKGIKLSWGKIPCDKYYIYRYDSKSKSYKLIKTTTATSYTNSGLSQMTKYTYRVKAAKIVNGKTHFNTAVQISAYTKPSAPTTFKLAVKNRAIKVSWSKNSKASGYQIYRSTDGWNYKLVKTVTSPNIVSWTNTGLSNDKYYSYKIRSYRKIGSTTYYSGFKTELNSYDPQSRLNAAALKSHRSFKVYNRQGKTTTSYTYTLSDKDIKILKNFAAKHFKSGMTREDKLWTTLNWINKNVKYATGADWNSISGKSWVDAIFTYKKGQCAQYNGAMTAMMAYLGYDVSLVQGYRGTWPGNYWQHFWCELNIDGLTYIMETGNYGKNGNWMYFVSKYSETSGYIRNRVNM